MTDRRDGKRLRKLRSVTKSEAPLAIAEHGPTLAAFFFFQTVSARPQPSNLMLNLPNPFKACLGC